MKKLSKEKLSKANYKKKCKLMKEIVLGKLKYVG